MNKKLNTQFIHQYKSVYADQLIKQSFDSDRISGKEIINISPTKQLNLFILKALFLKWQDEFKKLESPFFNYKHHDVRNAMVQFMNVLSQHISIDSKTIKPLIELALVETLTLAYSPKEYLKDLLESKKDENLTSKATNQLMKYLVYYKVEMKEYFNKMVGEPMIETIDKADEYFSKVDFQSKSLISELSKVVVLEENDILESVFNLKNPLEKIFEEAAVQLRDEEVSDAIFQHEEDNDIDDQVLEEDTEDIIEGQTNEEEKHEGDSFFESDEEEKDDSTTSDESEINLSEDEWSDDDKEIIDEPVEKTTINQKYEVEAKTIADLHEDKKIDSILTAISINHKYMFIQELFDGNNEEFIEAIEEVESCETFDDAVEFLVQNYSKEYYWDMNSDEVKELLKVIFRRFR